MKYKITFLLIKRNREIKTKSTRLYKKRKKNANRKKNSHGRDNYQ